MENMTNVYFSLDAFDHDMKLAMALSAEEAMKSKELDIGGSSWWSWVLTHLSGTKDVLFVNRVEAVLYFCSVESSLFMH